MLPAANAVNLQADLDKISGRIYPIKHTDSSGIVDFYGYVKAGDCSLVPNESGGYDIILSKKGEEAYKLLSFSLRDSYEKMPNLDQRRRLALSMKEARNGYKFPDQFVDCLALQHTLRLRLQQGPY